MELYRQHFGRALLMSALVESSLSHCRNLALFFMCSNYFNTGFLSENKDSLYLQDIKYTIETAFEIRNIDFFVCNQLINITNIKYCIS